MTPLNKDIYKIKNKKNIGLDSSVERRHYEAEVVDQTPLYSNCLCSHQNYLNKKVSKHIKTTTKKCEVNEKLTALGRGQQKSL